MRGAFVGQFDAQAAPIFEVDPFGEFSLGAQLVEIVGDQAGVPSDLVLAALLTVDLLDHDEGDHDLVVLEGVDRIRIVQQDVGVEDVDLLHASARCRRDELAYSPWFSNGRSAAIFVIR